MNTNFMMLGLTCEPLPAHSVMGLPSSSALGAICLSCYGRCGQRFRDCFFYAQHISNRSEAVTNQKQEGKTGFNV